MKQHLCKDRPDFDPATDDGWVEGGVTGCPYHGHDGRKQLGYRPGKGDRRKADQAAGVVGVDRGHDQGGYISGTER